jgi:hypothetical protein
VIGDLGKMQALFDVVKKDVVIDDSWDVLDFADRAQNLTAGNADFRELPITGQPVLPADGSVNTVNPLQIRQIVMTGFGDAKEFADEMAQNADGNGDPASALGPHRLTDPGTGLGQDRSMLPAATALPPLPAVRGTASGMRPAAIAPTDTHTVVDLYNATTKSGMAASVGDWLAASGWPVDKTSAAASQSRTTILYGKGAAKAAGQLAAMLGVQAVPAPSARTAAGHVLIRLGADYTPPGGPQPAAPSDTTGSGPADPASPDPAGPQDPADLPGISMDSGITCVN